MSDRVDLNQVVNEGFVLESTSFRQAMPRLPKYGRMIIDKDTDTCFFNKGTPHRPDWVKVMSPSETTVAETTVNVDIASEVISEIIPGTNLSWDSATANKLNVARDLIYYSNDNTKYIRLSEGDARYLQLAGKTGGQYARGGLDTTDTLKFAATAGISAAGANIEFLYGTDGGSRAAYFDYQGKFNMDVLPHATVDTDKFVVGDGTLISYRTGTEIISDLDLANLYTSRALVNGAFQESFNCLATSDGTTITATLEQSGGGDLTMQFSDGNLVLDCTPADSVVLTPGTDTSPEENWVYIPLSTKTLTANTTGWPSEEHIPVSYFYLKSATHVQSRGAIINQNWNDHLSGTNGQGHMSHIGMWIRSQGANWFSGCDGAGTDGWVTIISGSPDNIYIKVGSGVISQMHQHTYVAKDTSATDYLNIPNHPTDPWHETQDLGTVLVDSTGASLSGKYYNVVIGGVANKTGEFSPLMAKLPSGSYSNLTDAVNDIDNYTSFEMPRQFNKESSTGFLIALLTFKHSPAGGGTFTLENSVSLRGTSGATGAAGTGTTLFEFPDNQFKVYDNLDITRALQFSLDSVTTGNTRTLTVPDGSGTIPLIEGLVGGQKLRGGTAVTDTLKFVATSGIGAAGANIEFLYGTDGDSVGGYFDYQGNLNTLSDLNVYGGRLNQGALDIYKWDLGFDTMALMKGSVAFGVDSEARGYASAVFNIENEAYGAGSAAFGYQTKANYDSSNTEFNTVVAQGSITAIIDTKTVTVVGDRSDEFSIGDTIALWVGGAEVNDSLVITDLTVYQQDGYTYTDIETDVAMANANAPGDPQLSFGLITDEHLDNTNYDSLTPGNDGYLIRQAIIASVTAFDGMTLDFVFSDGDQVQHQILGTGTTPNKPEITDFKEILNAGTYDWFVSLGNHDMLDATRDSFVAEIEQETSDLVAKGLTNLDSPSVGDYFSFDVNGMHIIVLNCLYDSSGNPKTGATAVSPYYFGSTQLAWLLQDLTDNSGKRTVVFNHVPLVTIPSTPIGYSQMDPTEATTALGYMTSSGDVIAVIGGHNHYQGETTINSIVHTCFDDLKGAAEASSNAYSKVIFTYDDEMQVTGYGTQDTYTETVISNYASGINASNVATAEFKKVNDQSGDYGFAIGIETNALGTGSFAGGRNTIAQSYLSNFIGRHNIDTGSGDSWVTTDPLWGIGIGLDAANKDNAITVFKDGITSIGTQDRVEKFNLDGRIGLKEQSAHPTSQTTDYGSIYIYDDKLYLYWDTSYLLESYWVKTVDDISFSTGNVGIGVLNATGNFQVVDTNPLLMLSSDGSNEAYSGTIRFTESTITEYKGGYVNFNGDTANRLEIGVHDVADALTASDTLAMSIFRIGGDVTVHTNLDITGTLTVNTIANGAVADDNIIVESAGVFKYRTVSDIITNELDGTYLRLDTANNPLVGDLEITKDNALLTVTATNNTNAQITIKGDGSGDDSILGLFEGGAVGSEYGVGLTYDGGDNTFYIKDYTAGSTSNMLSITRTTNHITTFGNFITPQSTSNAVGVFMRGSDTFIHDYVGAGTTEENLFFGINAGNFSSSRDVAVYRTGDDNIGIGTDVLSSLDNGGRNTVIGNHAAESLVDDFWLTAMGFRAFQNTAVALGQLYSAGFGFEVAMNNTLGNHLTAMGVRSLYSNRLGDHNTSSGYYSLFNVYDADYNTGMGYRVFAKDNSAEPPVRSATLGSYNSGFGANIGLVYTGSNSTFIGYGTGSTQVSGDGSIFIGYNVTGKALTDLSAATTTASLLNIGDLIYGDLANGYMRVKSRLGVNVKPDYTFHIKGSTTAWTANFAVDQDNSVSASAAQMQLRAVDNSSPAANDGLGILYFKGNDGAASPAIFNYARIYGKIDSATNAAEAGKILFDLAKAGVHNQNAMTLTEDGLDIVDTLTVNDIGNDTGDFLTAPTGGGLVTMRTAAQVVSDLGGMAGLNYWTLNGTDLYYTGGNVGVGTATPDKLLHVYAGNSGGSPHSSSQLVFEDNASSYIQVLTPNNVWAGLLFGDPESTTIGGFLYDHSTDNLYIRSGGQNSIIAGAYGDISITSTLTIGSIANGTGNFLTESSGLVKYRTPAEVVSDLGIATDYLKLDCSNDPLTGDLTINGSLDVYENSTNTVPQLTIQQDGTGDAGIRFLLTSNAWSLGVDNSGGDSFGISNVNYGIDSSAYFTIKTSGNVLIGTTTDSAKLTVKAGGVTSADGIRVISSTNTERIITLQDSFSGNRGYLAMHSGGVQKITLDTGGDSYFNGGDLSIGTTASGAKLRVHDSGTSGVSIWLTDADATSGTFLKLSSDEDFIIHNQENTHVRIYTNDTERFRVMNTGQVNINNTTNTTYQFYVDGTGYFSGDLTIAGTVQATTGLFTNLTGGFVPYHASDALGLDNSAIYYTGTNVGIATTIPKGQLDISNGNAGSTPALVIGADLNAITRTDATRKFAVMAMPHYTNGEELFVFLVGNSDGSLNDLRIGGGVGAGNAATQIRFFTAANVTTTSGTLALTIDGSQDATFAGNVNIAIAKTYQINGVTIITPSASFDDTNDTLGASMKAIKDYGDANWSDAAMVYPGAGIAVSTGSAWGTSITDNSTNWNTAYTHSQLTSGNPHSVTASDIGLGSVENTALSTWAGSANITTLGTIATGVWNGTVIPINKGGTGVTSDINTAGVLNNIAYLDQANVFDRNQTINNGSAVTSLIVTNTAPTTITYGISSTTASGTVTNAAFRGNASGGITTNLAFWAETGESLFEDIITATLTANDASAYPLVLQNLGTAGISHSVGIKFEGTSSVVGAKVEMTFASSTTAGLAFSTLHSGTLYERLRIESDGDLRIKYSDGSDTPDTGYGYLRAKSATSLVWVAAGTGTEQELIGGGGAGTVTSVDMSVPTGLAISGNPITTSGTLALTYTAGYSIPTDSAQTSWDGKQDALTFGIAFDSVSKIVSASVGSGEYARFTASGLEGRTTAEVLADLGTVGNTAFNKDFGTSSITVAYGNHAHAGVYEPAFSKNTAFNKNFAGTGSATTPSRSDHTHSVYAPLGSGAYHTEFINITNNTASNTCLYIRPHASQVGDMLTIRDKGNTADVFAVYPSEYIAVRYGTSINEFSIDGTFAGNSDDALPTEKAVKTYVDAQIGFSVGDAHTWTADQLYSDGTKVKFGGGADVRMFWDNTPSEFVIEADYDGGVYDTIVIKTTLGGELLRFNYPNMGSTAIDITDEHIIITGLPTSASGLATGTLWNDSGTLKIVT